MSVPITNGQGQSSIAAELIGTDKYQQIKVVGGEVGSTSVMGVNPDRSINVSVVGVINIAGSVVAVQTGTRITSIVSSIPSSVIVGASIFGQLPAGTAVLGSIATLQGTNPWTVVNPAGSVTAVTFAAAANQSVSGAVTAPPGSVMTVAALAGSIMSVSATAPAGSVLTVAAVAGSVMAVSATAPAGSVMAVSGTTTAGSVMSVTNPAGSVTAVRTDTASVITVNQSSSVIAIVTGSVVAITNAASIITVWKDSSVLSVPVGSTIAVLQSPSIVGTYAEDTAHTTGDKGVFVLGVRNDAVASFTSANLEYIPLGTDSAGRFVTKPFSPEESRVEGYNSVVSTSVTTLVGAAGTGLKNYITDIQIANTGATTTLVTFKSGGGTSVLGYTIAPTGGGSNITFQTPIRTLANETFDFQATTSTSVLFATVKGFKAP